MILLCHAAAVGVLRNMKFLGKQFYAIFSHSKTWHYVKLPEDYWNGSLMALDGHINAESRKIKNLVRMTQTAS